MYTTNCTHPTLDTIPPHPCSFDYNHLMIILSLHYVIFEWQQLNNY